MEPILNTLLLDTDRHKLSFVVLHGLFKSLETVEEELHQADQCQCLFKHLQQHLGTGKWSGGRFVVGHVMWFYQPAINYWRQRETTGLDMMSSPCTLHDLR